MDEHVATTERPWLQITPETPIEPGILVRSSAHTAPVEIVAAGPEWVAFRRSGSLPPTTMPRAYLNGGWRVQQTEPVVNEFAELAWLKMDEARELRMALDRLHGALVDMHGLFAATTIDFVMAKQEDPAAQRDAVLAWFLPLAERIAGMIESTSPGHLDHAIAKAQAYRTASR